MITPQVEERLNDLLDPVRDQSVGALLQALAGELDSGAEVTPEPVERDAEGRVSRHGVLSLPRRADLVVTREGRSLIRRVADPATPQFEPLCLVAEGGFTTTISPFCWEEVDLFVECRRTPPDWTPLRRWYLEWFQSRFGDLAPDLEGAVHALTGPAETPGGFRLVVDFGSAPVAAFTAMLSAMEETGALRLRVGREV